MPRLGRRAFLAAATLLPAVARPARAAQPLSLDEFLALSQRLTAHTNLDRDAAAALLKALLDRPGGSAALARPDEALEREIVAAWYTGIGVVRGERRLLTHAGALQWRALGMPAPGTCPGRFGDWAKPPR